jgi:hypothetical protein
MTSYDIPMDSSVGDVLYYFNETGTTKLDCDILNLFEVAIEKLYHDGKHVTLKKIINLLNKYKDIDENQERMIIYTSTIDEIKKCIREIKSRKY